ncbi:MAG: NAD(P)-binding domain-containing protein, partial [Gammaproteobacteria bacterium]|nr:NAD(P)-binding domain-containing protein [Gammaproteobacteria bacterium]
MILLDTHVLLWSRVGVGRIGPKCRRLFEQGLRDATLAASAISFWEVAMLQEKGRIRGVGFVDAPVSGGEAGAQ